MHTDWGTKDNFTNNEKMIQAAHLSNRKANVARKNKRPQTQ
jgi:hypothetical protein